MDYSKLSDFEINKRVFNILMKGRCWDRQGNGVFNYCNNPADAWPIITEHMIAIIPRNLKDGRWDAHINEWDFAASHENPLRAAMTAFLKMQESANAPTNPAGPDIR